jgi:hypothetical protein
LWRLRRAVAIETGLFQIQAQIISDRQNTCESYDDPTDPLKVFYDILRQSRCKPGVTRRTQENSESQRLTDQQNIPSVKVASRGFDPVQMAVCYLRLENFNPAKLDLIGRYETRLWRQLAQTLVLLHSIRLRPSPIRKFPW